MPRKSDKQKLKELVELIGFSGLVATEDNKFFRDEEYLTLLSSIEFYRYAVDRIPIPKSRHWLETVLSYEDYNEERFRSNLRMDRQSFIDLLACVQGKVQLIGRNIYMPIKYMELINSCFLTGNEVFTNNQEPLPVLLGYANV